MASENYNVVIDYLDSVNEALKVKEEIEAKYKVEVLTIKADVSNEDDVKNMVTKVINYFGHIDCLVNNAGIAIDSIPEEKKVEDFKRILDVNLIGPFLVSREVSKYMLKEKKGSIVNISSTNGIDTYYSYSLDYDASKAGVISLTHNQAKMYAPYIRVNSVAPGWVMTDMNKDLDSDYIKEEEDKILLKRFASTDEIASVVAFLLSEEASYINDAIIRVDGGVNR
jgi:3-oxoacyl-[acyl-carrier protein] reductase